MGNSAIITCMLFSRSTPVVKNEAPMVLRIKVPWYEPFDVETKYFGTFRVQLTSVQVDGTTVIQIAGCPVKTKHTPKNAVRQICGLSGAFETQEQAIHGWEKGFVLLTLDKEQAAIAHAIGKQMLKRRQAEILQMQPEAEPR